MSDTKTVAVPIRTLRDILSAVQKAERDCDHIRSHLYSVQSGSSGCSHAISLASTVSSDLRTAGNDLEAAIRASQP